MEAVTKYIGVAGGLILVYLLVTNWEGFKAILNSMSLANMGAISALQGRGAQVGNASFAAGSPSSRAPR